MLEPILYYKNSIHFIYSTLTSYETKYKGYGESFLSVHLWLFLLTPLQESLLFQSFSGLGGMGSYGHRLILGSVQLR